MTMDSLRRVMQRIRARHGMTIKKIKRKDLRRAIMLECGTSPMTYYNNKAPLVELGWISTKHYDVFITGKDLVDDYESF